VSGIPFHGDPTPTAPPGPAGRQPPRPPRPGAPPGPAGRVREGTLEEEVRRALAGLDEAELGAHPGAFEALSAAIVAELRSLEEL
jgi:hypothetical protein